MKRQHPRVHKPITIVNYIDFLPYPVHDSQTPNFANGICENQNIVYYNNNGPQAQAYGPFIIDMYILSIFMRAEIFLLCGQPAADMSLLFVFLKYCLYLLVQRGRKHGQRLSKVFVNS